MKRYSLYFFLSVSCVRSWTKSPIYTNRIRDFIIKCMCGLCSTVRTIVNCCTLQHTFWKWKIKINLYFVDIIWDSNRFYTKCSFCCILNVYIWALICRLLFWNKFYSSHNKKWTTENYKKKKKNIRLKFTPSRIFIIPMCVVCKKKKQFFLLAVRLFVCQTNYKSVDFIYVFLINLIW